MFNEVPLLKNWNLVLMLALKFIMNKKACIKEIVWVEEMGILRHSITENTNKSRVTFIYI